MSLRPSNDSIVCAKDEVSLTKESSRLHHIRREKLVRQWLPERQMERAVGLCMMGIES